MERKKIFVILSAVMVCFLFAFGCADNNADNNSDDKQQAVIDELRLEQKRLLAVTEIQNIMGTYSMWVTSGFCFRVPELFTTSNDTVVEMVWGRYTGKDAAYRAYAVDHRGFDTGTIAALGLDVPPIGNANAQSRGGTPPPDAGGRRSVPPIENANAQSRGGTPPPDAGGSRPVTFVMHLLTTPVIQVAKDGQTARGVWTSPGIASGNWAWMKYGCDFKIEDGKWKIWHLHVYGLFSADYDKGWGVLEYEEPPTTASRSADKPPTTGWDYYKDATYIPLEPAPPEPYDTWDENKIVPGTYGEHR